MLAKLDRFETALLEAFRRLGAEKSSLILAVSGGADSVAMLAASATVAPRLGLKLVAVTVDHGLRPESKAEVRSVQALGEALGVEVVVQRLKLRRGAAIEARARAARYECLEAIRRERAADFVTTAHTASDQAETVLMRLLRGSALGGAASILEQRQQVLRPMLFATRDEVRQWLKRRKLRWHDDPMNDDEAFFRVAVRKKLLPAVEKVSPGATERLARFAGFAAEDEAGYAARARAALQRIRLSADSLDAVALRHLEGPLQRRVLAAFLADRAVEVDARQLSTMVSRCLSGSGTATLKRDLLLTVRAGVARIERAPGRKTQNFT